MEELEKETSEYFHAAKDSISIYRLKDGKEKDSME